MKTITIDGVEYNLLPKVKFKAGDWIANDYCAGKVIALTDDAYLLDSGQGIPFSCEHNAHLWTIQDAMNGEILVTEDYIFIFKHILYGGVHLYCHYDIDNDEFDSDTPDVVIGNIHDKGAHFRPAAKEQRDLFFTKMRETGYQWDSEKKELRKIKPHYNIANFKPFDKVLVRQNDSSTWGVSFFGRSSGGMFCCVNNIWYEQCIPFEGNEHLLGTTDMCDEMYINWKLRKI